MLQAPSFSQGFFWSLWFVLPQLILSIPLGQQVFFADAAMALASNIPDVADNTSINAANKTAMYFNTQIYV